MNEKILGLFDSCPLPRGDEVHDNYMKAAFAAGIIAARLLFSAELKINMRGVKAEEIHDAAQKIGVDALKAIRRIQAERN